MKIYVAIPRFALSGGNLVSLELAKHLNSIGFSVYCHSGFKIQLADDVQLVPPMRGRLNTVLNLVSFLFLSVWSLFHSNVISTHHLTSIFNFIKRSRFALVQDVEVDFYPAKCKFIGKRLWKNYLNSRYLIFTNEILAERVCLESAREVKGFSFVPIMMPKLDKRIVDNEVVLVVRDGTYKAPERTLKTAIELSKQNVEFVAINATRKSISSINAIKNVSRSEFIDILLRSKIFICLSKWEGLGLPNVEAYLAGCRVISTAIPSALILKKINPNAVDIIHDDCTPHEIAELAKTNGNCNESCYSYFDVCGRTNQIVACHELWLEYASGIVQRGCCK